MISDSLSVPPFIILGANLWMGSDLPKHTPHWVLHRGTLFSGDCSATVLTVPAQQPQASQLQIIWKNACSLFLEHFLKELQVPRVVYVASEMDQ